MKINESRRIGAINTYRNQDQSAYHASNKKSSRKDEVQISSEAKELLGMERSDTQSQEVRKQRIEELRNSINSGTYHRDARIIAEKLLPYIKD